MVSEKSRARIIGVGAFLPSTIRTNDWWPQSTVERWRERLRAIFPQRVERAVESLTPGNQKVLAAIEDVAHDPFGGALERRIAEPEMLSSEMEERAARMALERAQITPEQVDVILVESLVPDYLAINHATIVHQRLGLRSDCIALQVTGMCVSLLAQLQLAAALLCSGRCRYALLVQSSAVSRLVPPDAPYAPIHGDAATAVVLTVDDGGAGLINTLFEVDGSNHRGMVCGVGKGRPWYADGPILAYPEDREELQRTILGAADAAKRVITELLAKNNLDPLEVDFYISHQPVVWFRGVTQDYSGINNARYIETFPWSASVVSSNMALQLYQAQNQGALQRGDIVAFFALAAGFSGAGALLHWG